MSSKQRLEFATFDVFTRTAFEGNPLAIVKVSTGFLLSQSQKQAIAREFNFSETVFLHEGEQTESAERRVDIFTTSEELPFAGHPTIGTICSIASAANAQSIEKLTLLTKAGPIQSEFDWGSSSAVATIPHDVHIHNDCLERSKVQQLYHSSGNRSHDDLLDMWPSNSDGSDSSFPVVSIVKGMSFVLIGFPGGGGRLQRIQIGHQLTYANALNVSSFGAFPFFSYVLLTQ